MDYKNYITKSAVKTEKLGLSDCVRRMKLVTLLAIILCFQSCKQNKPFDLAIVDANIFDALTGTIIQNKTILIRADTIANIIDRSEIFSAKTN